MNSLEKRVAKLERALQRKCEVRGLIVNTTPLQSDVSAKWEDYDLDNCEYVTVYVDGDDVGSANANGRSLWEALKICMKELSDYALSEIKGVEKEAEYEVYIEFTDRHDNVIEEFDLPSLYTNIYGHLLVDDIRPGVKKDLESLCIRAFNKLTYLPA